MKTTFGDSHYRVRWLEERQSGAVLHRALEVMPAYLLHARRLDLAHSMAGTTRVHLSIETRLLSYSPVRRLVFGWYGKASADVHSLIAVAASARVSIVVVLDRCSPLLHGQTWPHLVIGPVCKPCGSEMKKNCGLPISV